MKPVAITCFGFGINIRTNKRSSSLPGTLKTQLGGPSKTRKLDISASKRHPADDTLSQQTKQMRTVTNKVSVNPPGHLSGWFAGTCANKTLPGTTGRTVPGEQEVRQMSRCPKRLATYLRLLVELGKEKKKERKRKGCWDLTQLVETLLSMHKSLASIPSTA